MARNGTATGLAPSRSVALRLRVVLIPLLAALVVACGGGRSVVAPSQAGPNAAAFVAPTPGKVAIISIDGLRADALVEAGAPNIQALAGRGAYTWRAQTILPSTTLPSHKIARAHV